MFFYNNNTDYREEIRNYWNNNVKKFRTTSLIAGIIMTILGILCFIFPVRSMLVLEYIASIFLIVAGIYQIYAFTALPVFLKTGGGLLTGILNVILGIMLITSPAEAMMSMFAIIIAINLMMLGVEECVAYSRARFYTVNNAGWLLVEGIINIIVSIIFMFMPAMTIALSYVIAIYLVVTGITCIYGSFSAKEMQMKD
ncbi:MAG: HdeD family acid-resistance protein [Lachnospiraceae bacterium]|jgi:uncharacterized membrane protein HdeD (DUF308 family)